MKRRKFIQTSASIAAGLSLPLTSYPMYPQAKYKMGFQLFSVRDAMEKDPMSTLQALKAMGYEDFETYGYDPKQDTYYGFKSTDFKQILDDMGLTTSSGHYGFSSYLMKSNDDLKWFVDRCILGAQALNKSYITWPWLDPEYRNIEHFKVMTDKLNLIGQQVTAAGLGFAYHNHDFEFSEHHGVTGYDLILKYTDPKLVKLQMDMYWVMHSSKLTPKQLIANQPGRYVMWHIKDMDKVTRDYTELGNGSIDYTEIMPDPKASGLEFYYLEQGGNYAHDSMRSAEDSATYFKEHLQKLL